MIVINVGGYKNGSTWVQNILTRTLPAVASGDLRANKPPPMPEPFERIRTNQQNKERLWKAFNYDNAEQDKFIRLKIHFWSEDPGVEIIPTDGKNIRFINIRRDPRDVLVSRFYHEKAGGLDGGFDAFFESRGRYYLDAYIKYHDFWLEFARARPGYVYHLEFEDLKSDFENQVKYMLAFLNVHEFDMEAVRSLQNLNENRKSFTWDWMKSFQKSGGNFYRKGIVGDYKNHMSNAQLERFTNWADELGYDRLARASLIP